MGGSPLIGTATGRVAPFPNPLSISDPDPVPVCMSTSNASYNASANSHAVPPLPLWLIFQMLATCTTLPAVACADHMRLGYLPAHLPH